jgi:hypothetical protein
LQPLRTSLCLQLLRQQLLVICSSAACG